MKRTDPMSIRQIIDHVLDASAGREAVLAHRAAALWSDIMGPTVTRHTTRRYVARGILHVYIDSAPLKNELGFRRTQIAQAINSALGAEVIASVQFH